MFATVCNAILLFLQDGNFVDYTVINSSILGIHGIKLLNYVKGKLLFNISVSETCLAGFKGFFFQLFAWQYSVFLSILSFCVVISLPRNYSCVPNKRKVTNKRRAL